MSDPYRQQILNNIDIEKPKNLYRYILRENSKCPICSKEIKKTIYIGFTLGNNPAYAFCHPLKRLVVKGMWWWKKYCPVEGVHHHLTCKECEVSWIIMDNDQTEAHPEIKDAYL